MEDKEIEKLLELSNNLKSYANNQKENKNKTEDKPMNVDLSKENIAIMTAIGKLDNPFKMIGVKEVMQDLGLGYSGVYKTFNRSDFPSINVGKSNKVMLLSYILWKMIRRN